MAGWYQNRRPSQPFGSSNSRRKGRRYARPLWNVAGVSPPSNVFLRAVDRVMARRFAKPTRRGPPLLGYGLALGALLLAAILVGWALARASGRAGVSNDVA